MSILKYLISSSSIHKPDLLQIDCLKLHLKTDEWAIVSGRCEKVCTVENIFVLLDLANSEEDREIDSIASPVTLLSPLPIHLK